MKIAENYPELATQTAEWFIQGLSNAVSANFFGAEAFKSKSTLKKSSNNLFKNFIQQRYAQYPDEKAEKWLYTNTSFKFGVMGFILDIVYIEADETSTSVLPMHFHNIPEEMPAVFHILIGHMTSSILNFLVSNDFPDQMIFGEFEDNKIFQEKLDKDYSEAIDYFAKQYISDFMKKKHRSNT